MPSFHDGTRVLQDAHGSALTPRTVGKACQVRARQVVLGACTLTVITC